MASPALPDYSPSRTPETVRSAPDSPGERLNFGESSYGRVELNWKRFIGRGPMLYVHKRKKSEI